MGRTGNSGRTCFVPWASMWNSTIRSWESGWPRSCATTTRLIWCESPCSVTMEVQDLPGIARAAAGRDVTIAIDNTYAAGILFDAFTHGAHVSVQALTKYIGGH